MDEITDMTTQSISVLDYFSHEGEALMEGAARSGFFIELKKDGKAEKAYYCNRWSGWGNYQTDPRDNQHFKGALYRHVTGDTGTVFIGGNHV